MDSQKVFFFDCSGSSFRRLPKSSHIKGLLDAGMRRHDVKFRFPSFCDAIIKDGLAKCRYLRFRALEILQVCLHTRKSTIPCIWRRQRCRPVEFLRVHHKRWTRKKYFIFPLAPGCHFGERRNPVISNSYWMPACAGMTESKRFRLFATPITLWYGRRQKKARQSLLFQGIHKRPAGAYSGFDSAASSSAIRRSMRAIRDRSAFASSLSTPSSSASS